MIKTIFPETLVHNVFFSNRKLNIGCVNFLSSKDTKCSIPLVIYRRHVLREEFGYFIATVSLSNLFQDILMQKSEK